MDYCRARVGHALGFCALGLPLSLSLSLASRASAATWAEERTTPRVVDLAIVDRSGEPGWLFGREDVAGDGLERFEAPERGIDLRSAYVASDGERLWARAYVSSAEAPSPALRVYVFIDADDDAATGGAGSSADIDPALGGESSRGGYDVVLGMRAGTVVGGVWLWSDQRDRYEPATLPPLAALAESGVDRDPLRVLTDSHGYVQLSLESRSLGVDASCAARVLLRSTAGDGPSDGDVGELARCVSGDADGDGARDALEATLEPGCERDDQCPAGALCMDRRCVLPAYCGGAADCADDESCDTNDVCRADGGDACNAEGGCAGGLVCEASTTCRACSNDGECGDGRRCAESGRCVTGDAASAADGVALAAGQQVQGGAGTCSTASGAGSASAAAFVSLLLLLLGMLQRRRLGRLALLSAALYLMSGNALAQVDAERLTPAVTHDGWIGAEGSAVRHPDDRWELDAMLHYARNPLVIASSQGDLERALVSGRFGMFLAGSASIGESFALGLGLPVFAQQGSGDPSAGGVGDLRLVPKLALTSDVEDGIGLALAAEVRAPTHGGDYSGSADSLSIFPKLILDHRYPGGLRVGANVGVIVREDQSFSNVTSGDELAYALGISQRLGGLAGRTELGVEVDGGVNLSDPGDEEVALEALGFLRHALDAEWIVQGGVGAGVLEGYGVPTWRVFLGFTFRPTSHDGDADGVSDSRDQCPDFQEDRDGVLDADGCPEEDADGDHDGVSDEDDRCPTTPETINGSADDDGCPDSGERRVLFDDGEFVVLDTIRFATGSAHIEPSAHSLLDQVALTLRAHPELEHVRIEGHTDDTGPREVNMALSQQRGLAVKRYLVERGVGPQRLIVRSYGPDRPREAGTDNRARARNRRVEFIVE
jgi:outer membrane protein OmpA-like peptidoglycan-associated protein